MGRVGRETHIYILGTHGQRRTHSSLGGRQRRYGSWEVRLGWGGAPSGVFTFLSAKQVRRRNIYRWAPVTTCAPPLVRPSVTREMTRRSNADGWLSIFQSERENGKERKEESQIQLLESIFRGAGVRLRLCPLR